MANQPKRNNLYFVNPLVKAEYINDEGATVEASFRPQFAISMDSNNTAELDFAVLLKTGKILPETVVVEVLSVRENVTVSKLDMAKEDKLALFSGNNAMAPATPAPTAADTINPDDDDIPF